MSRDEIRHVDNFLTTELFEGCSSSELKRVWNVLEWVLPRIVLPLLSGEEIVKHKDVGV